MNALITREEAAIFLRLKTPEAAEKLLARLGVQKINYAIIGSKGVRYRTAEIEEALDKISVESNKKSKLRIKKRPRTDVFDLPVKEQVALLTANSVQH
jgi:hypothetical protein